MFDVPTIRPVETNEPGVRAMLYDGVPWRGAPTRIFAYHGRPPRTDGRKVPAIVLVHGGLGSAYAEWVRLWTRRGYAAIAMDHFGCIPDTAPNGDPYNFARHRHPFSGPVGAGGFDQVDEPVADQWMFHAVSAVIGAHSVLRSLPDVDASRVGLTGISWGGVVASIAATVDRRFRFAAPIYGCGHLTEHTTFFDDDLAALSNDQRARWAALWDPANHLDRIAIPTLWMNGTNDPAFALPSWRQSVARVPGEVVRSILPSFPHGQHEGATPNEIAVFADGILNGGPPLPRVGPLRPSADGLFQVALALPVPIRGVNLHATRDAGDWIARRWTATPLTNPRSDGNVTFRVPPETTAFFVNVVDERGCQTSSDVEVRA